MFTDRAAGIRVLKYGIKYWTQRATAICLFPSPMAGHGLSASSPESSWSIQTAHCGGRCACAMLLTQKSSLLASWSCFHPTSPTLLVMLMPTKARPCVIPSCERDGCLWCTAEGHSSAVAFETALPLPLAFLFVPP